MKTIAIIFTFLCTAGGAIAETTMVPTLDQSGRRGDVARQAKEKAVAKFDAADANKDGKLSKEELAASFPYMAQNFDKLDADKDGFLSWEEYVGHNRWPK